MPAAVVIPAPIAYIKVVVIKKLIVGSRQSEGCSLARGLRVCLIECNWRASLVPAAAVIPAPIAYIKVVAVKKLVVGFLLGTSGPPSG